MDHTRSSAAEPDKQEARKKDDMNQTQSAEPDANNAEAAENPVEKADAPETGDAPAQENETGPEAAAEAGGETGREEPAGTEAGGANAADGEAETIRRELEETQQRLLRLQADYDNFRRRTRLEKEEFAKYASLNVVEKLLPVLDNFERALAAGQNAQDLDSFVKGVDMIFRQLTDVLAQEGLEPIQAVGEPFNPEFHQAVMQVESEEHDDNIVVEELQKGYMLKEKVIRPSMVKVNARP